MPATASPHSLLAQLVHCCATSYRCHHMSTNAPPYPLVQHHTYLCHNMAFAGHGTIASRLNNGATTCLLLSHFTHCWDILYLLLCCNLPTVTITHLNSAATTCPLLHTSPHCCSVAHWYVPHRSCPTSPALAHHAHYSLISLTTASSQHCCHQLDPCCQNMPNIAKYALPKQNI